MDLSEDITVASIAKVREDKSLMEISQDAEGLTGEDTIGNKK